MAEKDPKLSDSQRQAVVQSYADRAMQLLRSAIQKGYKDTEDLKKNPQLATLQAREDFKKLVSELEQAR